MSTTTTQRQYPTLTLGTAYKIDTLDVVDELTHLATLVEGDLRNYTDHATNHSSSITLTITDAYPSRKLTLDNQSYLPPINDWDTARITIHPTENTDSTPSDLTATFLISHSDLAHTLERFTVSKRNTNPQ